MLKNVIFFLFGCSLYYGQQSVAIGGTASNQTGGVSIQAFDGNGTKTTSTSGEGSGTNSSQIELLLQQQTIEELYVYLNKPDIFFNRYTIHDKAGNLKKDMKIRDTNSHSIDVSNLEQGNYFISVYIIIPTGVITKQFIKQ